MNNSEQSLSFLVTQFSVEGMYQTNYFTDKYRIINHDEHSEIKHTKLWEASWWT